MSESPLLGRVVVVCRPADRAASLIDGLQRVGAVVVHLPLVEPVLPADGGAELRSVLADLTSTDWLAFTSASAAPFVVDAAPQWPPPCRMAAIGSATEAALLGHGGSVAFTAPTATAASLGATLPAEPGDLVVAPLAELAGPDLVDQLTKRGIQVVTPIAYRLRHPDQDPTLIEAAAAADLVVFTSPSIVDNYLALVGRPRGAVVSIGPRTSAAARAVGIDGVVEAVPHDVDGLIAAVINTIGA